MSIPGRPAFTRSLALPGWDPRSAWGFDEVFECYWAELRPVACGSGVRLGPERLLVTLGALACALAGAAGCAPEDAYLALTD